MSGITLDEIQAEFHSIKISNGTDDLLIDGSGHISINDGGNSITVDGAVTVSATDLDIRSLVFATDKVDVSGSSITVTATDLDIRDLAFATDKVDVSGSSVLTTPDAYDIWQTSVVSASTTVGEIAATPLSNRLNMLIQNLGNADVYIGEDNTVVVGTGVKVPKGGSAEFLFGANANIWAITSSGTADLRIAEFAA
jgi:hypothetical protein